MVLAAIFSWVYAAEPKITAQTLNTTSSNSTAKASSSQSAEKSIAKDVGAAKKAYLDLILKHSLEGRLLYLEQLSNEFKLSKTDATELIKTSVKDSKDYYSFIQKLRSEFLSGFRDQRTFGIIIFIIVMFLIVFGLYLAFIQFRIALGLNSSQINQLFNKLFKGKSILLRNENLLKNFENEKKTIEQIPETKRTSEQKTDLSKIELKVYEIKNTINTQKEQVDLLEAHYKSLMKKFSQDPSHIKTEIEIAESRVKITSSVIGFVILAFSLAFFYLYLTNVYPIFLVG